jgi:hypothetical protein
MLFLFHFFFEMALVIAAQGLGTVLSISLQGGVIGGLGAFVLCRLCNVSQHNGYAGGSEENIWVFCSALTGFLIGVGLGVAKVLH